LAVGTRALEFILGLIDFLGAFFIKIINYFTWINKLYIIINEFIYEKELMEINLYVN